MGEISKYEDSGSGAELSKRDNLPDQSFSGRGQHSGPVLLDIEGDSIDGTVTVGDVDFASVRVFTRSTVQAVIDAVRKTKIYLSGSTLTVKVPNFQVPPTVIQGGNSRMVFSGNVSFVSVGRGATVIGGSGSGEDMVRVEVTLPRNSGVRADLGSGLLDVHGDLVGIDGDLSSGSIAVHGSVGKARAELSSGSFRIGRVTEGIEATASSGSLNVGEYTGSHAKLRISSGSMNLNVGRDASGTIDVRVSSGSANIGGTRGRTDLDIRTKKSSGSINLY
jgi:hypothetical protein